MVVVWYRNGRSVLGFDPRERDIARSVCGHSDIDRSTLGKLVGSRFRIAILEFVELDKKSALAHVVNAYNGANTTTLPLVRTKNWDILH
jgi:hypothetical protein